MTADERRGALSNSLVAGVYEQVLDRESAYERLKGVRGQANPQVGAGSTAIPTGMPPASAQTAPQAEGSGWSDALFGRTGPRGGQYDGLVQTVGKSVARQVGSQIGREIVRGLLGSIMGGRRR
jgi:hypothetical protein